MATRTLPLSKRGFNFETIMWIYARHCAVDIWVDPGWAYGALILRRQGANWRIFCTVLLPQPQGNPLARILHHHSSAVMVTVLCWRFRLGAGVLEILMIISKLLCRRWSRNFIITSPSGNIIALFIWTKKINRPERKARKTLHWVLSDLRGEKV